MFQRSSFNLQKVVILRLGIKRNTSVRGFYVYSDEYQFIQRSFVPTLHFQKSLPRLPIPELEKTCERYLTAQKPLLSENDYDETKKVVEDFKKNEGKKLQDELKREDLLNSDTSYISKPWFDMYLSDRIPLPLNYNPVLVFNKSVPAQNNNSQLIRASNYVISSLRFLRSLRKNILYPEVYHLNPKKSDTNLFKICTRITPPSLSWYGAYLFKAFPLDMSQYSSLFGSTRIPKLDKDVLFRDESSRHILVLRKGHFFTFDALDKNGNILCSQDIMANIEYILNKNLELNKKSLGILTTENRNTWAKLREYLISISNENYNSLKAIDSSLFVLCLDDEAINSDIPKMMSTFLLGNAYNRWFDKSFSLLISEDGEAAVNFEHSWGDGVAILRYFQDIYKDTNENLFVQETSSFSDVKPAGLVRELTFTIDEKISADLETAKRRYDNVCESVTFDVLEFNKLSKKHCKNAQIGPDSIMQLAFQVAYHRVFGTFTATYESCSTAAFKHGRTETVRPCTIATKQFALSLNGKNRPCRAELIEMIKTCSFVHGKLTKEAAMGEGFDRHLFGLKDLSIRTGYGVPFLYGDDAYKKINHNILSTSTLSSNAVLLGGFGPVVPDGYGIGYKITNDSCGAVVSSYPSNRNGSDFISALESVLHDISGIISSK